MATKQAPVAAKANCDACGVDSDHASIELAQVQTVQVVRCVDPVACRIRAQKTGTWALA